MEQRPTAIKFYTGQFDTLADPLSIAIPRDEILAEMVATGESASLDAVCIAVAVVMDALTQASLPES